jgi:hypothetical protein
VPASPGTAAPPPPPAPSPAASVDASEEITSGSAMAPPEPPLSPPIMPMPGASDAQAGAMTPEESIALREQRFQKMHERFVQQRKEAAERWESYWRILDAMTPEQKEAIEAVFGNARGRCRPPRRMGSQMPPAMPMRPPVGQPDYGFSSGSGFPGSGPGFGPQGAQPYPYDRSPAGSWYGDQPMYPGAAESWYDPDQGSYQGPPPPTGNYTQPW